jgi:hypothetical protein
MQNNDPQTIWQNQNTEEIKVSLAYFRQRAEHQRTKNIRAVVATYLVYLGTIVVIAIISWRSPNLTSLVGCGLLTIGLLYAIAQRHKHLWPSPPASDASPDSGLVAYRHELLRSQSDQRNALRMLAPLLPGAIVFAYPGVAPLVHAASANPAVLINGIPFLVLLAAWLVLFPVMRNRRMKEIQRELDALGS